MKVLYRLFMSLHVGIYRLGGDSILGSVAGMPGVDSTYGWPQNGQEAIAPAFILAGWRDLRYHGPCRGGSQQPGLVL